MQLSDDGVFQLASHEGIVVNPYYDSVRVITFGIGHTAGAGDPHPASIKYLENPDDERYKLVFDVFKKDIKKFENRVNEAVKVPLTQYQFDALVSFDFNTGGIKTANLTKRLNAGDISGAADGFMGWLKPVEIKGRRTAEMNLFKTGEYDLTRTIGVYQSSPTFVRGSIKRQMKYSEFMSYMGEQEEKPFNIKDYPLLKIGSTGDYVSLLQQILAVQYPNIGKADGIFGKNTDAAVRAFQKNNGLVADGMVGQKTWSVIFGV